jgi:thiosulfate/3-mercaptopyruvate sulfurtransferase
MSTAIVVTAAELAAQGDDPTWIVCDCRHDLVDKGRGERVYRAGHIPGAHFVPVETAMSGAKTGRNGRHPLPEPRAWAAFLAGLGVTRESTLVAYDDAGGLYAARCWWLARWIGLERVALLDGGLTRWLAEGRPLTAEVPGARAAAEPPAVVAAAMPVRTVDEVERRLGHAGSLVLDARAAERFRGENETIDPVAGHIPGAANRFYRSNLNADQTFRPAAELRREFEALLAGRAPADVAHQCGSGITACANLFAMEHAGLAGSALYAGSWSEWVADPRRPVATGA